MPDGAPYPISSPIGSPERMTELMDNNNNNNIDNTDNTEELKPRPKGSKRAKGLVRMIKILFILNISLLVLCLVLFFRVMKLEQDVTKLSTANTDLQVSLEQAELHEEQMQDLVDQEISSNETLTTLRSYAEQGKSFITTLKALFPTQFVLADEGIFHFIDIDHSLKANGLDDSKMSLDDNGLLVYDDEDEIISYGIDVSQHNGVIDWETMAAAERKPDFIYVRAGIRGYGSGKLVPDEQISANMIGANTVADHVGVYFVTQAITPEEAREEARSVLEWTADYEMDLPIAIDVEKIEDYETEPRTLHLTSEEYTANVLAFIDELNKNGKKAIIYGNGKTFMLMLDPMKLDDTEKWFADYVAENDFTPYFPYDFRIWQFTSKGSMDGISGECDVNIAFNLGKLLEPGDD